MENDLPRLVNDWIAFHKSVKDSEEYNDLLGIILEVDIDLTRENPNEAWQFIQMVLATDGSGVEEIMGPLAAGPVENLLTHHGPVVIDRVEQEARSNPKFAELLGGVWKFQMSDDIWHRVQLVWDRRNWK